MIAVILVYGSTHKNVGIDGGHPILVSDFPYFGSRSSLHYDANVQKNKWTDKKINQSLINFLNSKFITKKKNFKIVQPTINKWSNKYSRLMEYLHFL